MPRTIPTKAWKVVDYAASKAAAGIFNAVQFFNGKIEPNPSFTPKWSSPRTSAAACPTTSA